MFARKKKPKNKTGKYQKLKTTSLLEICKLPQASNLIAVDKRGIQMNIFLISPQKIWLLARSALAKLFYWVPQHMFSWINKKDTISFGEKVPKLVLWVPVNIHAMKKTFPNTIVLCIYAGSAILNFCNSSPQSYCRSFLITILYVISIWFSPLL